MPSGTGSWVQTQPLSPVPPAWGSAKRRDPLRGRGRVGGTAHRHHPEHLTAVKHQLEVMEVVERRLPGHVLCLLAQEPRGPQGQGHVDVIGPARGEGSVSSPAPRLLPTPRVPTLPVPLAPAASWHGSPGQVKGVIDDLGTVDHGDGLGEGRVSVSGQP